MEDVDGLHEAEDSALAIRAAKALVVRVNKACCCSGISLAIKASEPSP